MSKPLQLVAGLGPCRIWQGALNSKGYGHVTMRGREYRVYKVNGEYRKTKRVRRVLAHRLSLADFLGVKVWQLNKVAHACDNRPCIEPSHLRSTTQKRNMADMVKRGRAAWQKDCHGNAEAAQIAA